MKIIQTIKREETIEKEISLPYFCKWEDDNYLKVISEDEFLWVKNGGVKGSSFYPNNVFHLDIARGIEITEDEFNRNYNEVIFHNGKYVPVPDAPKELIEASKQLLHVYRDETNLINGDNETTIKMHNALAKFEQ